MRMLGKTGLVCLLAMGALALGPASHAENVTLCYHHFDHSLQDLYSVLPEVFEWQVQYIRTRGIPLIRLQTLVDAYASSTESWGGNVLVTVDDGWRDILQAMPVAEKYQIPMTLFLYPQVLDHGSYLTYGELDALKKNPLLDFGCHSYSHPVLRHLAAPALRREVVESKAWLEARLGRKVETFAYPFGMFDAATRNLVKTEYKLAFGVNDGGNRRSTHPSNLNRFVIYRTTSFGEFMDMISRTSEAPVQTRYASANLGDGNEGKGFIYTKAQVYRFPPEPLQHAVLIIPGMQIGAAWTHKAVEAFNRQGVQAYVLVTRNNNIPFYRPDKQIMQEVGGWGLSDYVQDLKTTLAYVRAREKQFAVLTWSDGFDWLAAAVAGDTACAEGLVGVLAVNPSLRNPDNAPDFFARERDRLDALRLQAQDDSESLSFYIKMKTLADLMIVKPEAPSPFARKLGYVAGWTNRQVFHEALDRLDHPELSIDETSGEYDVEAFKGAFMQPLPVFSMVVPLKVRRDFYDFWARRASSLAGAMPTADAWRAPLAVWDAKSYRSNPSRILRAFPGLHLQAEYKLDEDSTVEILLSNSTIRQMTDELLRFFPQPAPLTVPEATPVPTPVPAVPRFSPGDAALYE